MLSVSQYKPNKTHYTDRIQFGSRIDAYKQKLIVTETYFNHSNKQLSLY